MKCKRDDVLHLGGSNQIKKKYRSGNDFLRINFPEKYLEIIGHKLKMCKKNNNLLQMQDKENML